MLCRDYMGKEADRLVTCIDPGVVSLVAEVRGDQRQAAEELGQCAEVDVPAKRVPNFRLSRESTAIGIVNARGKNALALILARRQTAEQGETRPCFRDADTAICDVVDGNT
jgi:hypothetical protein